MMTGRITYVGPPAARGLGYNPVIGPGGQVIDCDQFWTMITNPGTCFNPFAQNAPTKIVADPTTGAPVVTPTVPNPVTQDVTSLFATVPWTSIALIAAGVVAIALIVRR
jgi:hypothetical protein